MLDRQAQKDYEELKRAGYQKKADAILTQLTINPFEPPNERLNGEYREFYSRRVNRTDRVVYTIRYGAGVDGEDVVVVSRMRTHYRGMLSLMML